MIFDYLNCKFDNFPAYVTIQGGLTFKYDANNFVSVSNDSCSKSIKFARSDCEQSRFTFIYISTSSALLTPASVTFFLLFHLPFESTHRLSRQSLPPEISALFFGTSFIAPPILRIASRVLILN